MIPQHHVRLLPVLLPALLPALLLAGQLAAQQFSPDPLQGLPAVASNPAQMVLLDSDGDGDLDLVVSNSSGQNRLFVNDGHGAFSDASGRLPTDNDTSLAVAAGDVDGDGDADLVFGNAWQQNRLYLNQGGTFTDQTSGRLPARNDGTQAVLFFDAEGDGDTDLLVGNQNAQNTLLLNDGKGSFTDVSGAQMPVDSDNTHGLVAADVDGDKDLDLVIGNDRTGNSLLLNDGRGRFSMASASAFPVFGDATYDVAVADVNGDSRPDILFANGLGQNRLYLNQGGGRFNDTPNNLPANNNSASFAVALGDVDGDGDLDAAIGNSFAQNELWLNDGKGSFSDATARLPQATNATSSVALADLDQDGDLDLVSGNSGGPLLLANHLRQVSRTGALKLGSNWTLTVSRAAGFATSSGVALPAVALGSRTRAVHFPGMGNLLIDTNAMVVLPRLGLPSPAGQASLPLKVPQDNSLLNLRISCQAVVADSQNGNARLTNALSEVVVQ